MNIKLGVLHKLLLVSVLVVTTCTYAAEQLFFLTVSNLTDSSLNLHDLKTHAFESATSDLSRKSAREAAAEVVPSDPSIVLPACSTKRILIGISNTTKRSLYEKYNVPEYTLSINSSRDRIFNFKMTAGLYASDSSTSLFAEYGLSDADVYKESIGYSPFSIPLHFFRFFNSNKKMEHDRFLQYTIPNKYRCNGSNKQSCVEINFSGTVNSPDAAYDLINTNVLIRPGGSKSKITCFPTQELFYTAFKSALESAIRANPESFTDDTTGKALYLGKDSSTTRIIFDDVSDTVPFLDVAESVEEISTKNEPIIKLESNVLISEFCNHDSVNQTFTAQSKSITISNSSSIAKVSSSGNTVATSYNISATAGAGGIYPVGTKWNFGIGYNKTWGDSEENATTQSYSQTISLPSSDVILQPLSCKRLVNRFTNRILRKTVSLRKAYTNDDGTEGFFSAPATICNATCLTPIKTIITGRVIDVFNSDTNSVLSKLVTKESTSDNLILQYTVEVKGQEFEKQTAFIETMEYSPARESEVVIELPR